MVGGGRVGQTLARLLVAHAGLQMGQLLCRSAAHTQAALAFIGSGSAVNALNDFSPADLWLITTPDGALADTAQALASTRAVSAGPPAHAWHCSGFHSHDLLAPLAAHGWALASVHPALSFASPESALAQWPGTLCAVEGDAAAVDQAQALLRATAAQPFAIDAQAKPLYHAGAVFASNFAPVLAATADSLWAQAGVPDAARRSLLHGFIARVAANIARDGPALALTGPVARGDGELLAAQLVALIEHDPDVGAAYEALSVLAARLSRSARR